MPQGWTIQQAPQTQGKWAIQSGPPDAPEAEMNQSILRRQLFQAPLGEPDPQPIPASISAAPPANLAHPINWLESAEADVRHGSNITWLGSVLKAMGAQGTESGTSPGTANMVGGPAVGPLRMARGHLRILSGHPIRGANELIGGAMQTAAPILGVTQPEFLPAATGWTIASTIAQTGLEKAGLDPETAEFLTNTLALGGGYAYMKVRPRKIGLPDSAQPKYEGPERRDQSREGIGNFDDRLVRNIVFADAREMLREAQSTNDPEQIHIAQERLHQLGILARAEDSGQKVFIPAREEPEVLRDPSQSGMWVMGGKRRAPVPTVPDVPVPIDPAQLLKQLSIFDENLSPDQTQYRNYIDRSIYNLSPRPKLKLSPSDIKKATEAHFDLIQNNAQAAALLQHITDPVLKERFIVSALDRLKASITELRNKGISESDLYAVRAGYANKAALDRAEEIMGKAFDNHLPTDRKLKLEAPPPRKVTESRAPKYVKAFSRELYRIPTARIAAAYLRLPKSRLASMGEAAIAERGIFVQDYDYITDRFLKDMERFMIQSGSDHDLDITKLGYALQGDLPITSLTPAGRIALERLRAFMNQQDELLRRAYGSEIPLQDAETYLTQVWDIDKKRDIHPVYNTLIRDRFLKAKSIDSYKKGIEELGLKPKFRNVLDIIRFRARYANRAIANQTFAQWLESQRFIMSEAKYKHTGMTGYVPALDTPALDKAAYGGTAKKTTRFGTDKVVTLYKRPVMVHPELRLAVDTIFQSPMQNIGFATLDTIRAVSKKMVLGGSFFHHIALAEQQSALGLGNLSAKMLLKGGGGLGFIYNPELARGFRDGLIDIFPRSAKATGLVKFKGEGPIWRWKAEAIRDPILHGLNLSSEEIDSAITKVLLEAGQNGPRWEKIVTAPLRGLGKTAHVMEKSLWDYMHQGQMLEAYYELTSRELNRLGPDATPDQIAQMKREVAEHVNKAFGAVNFERMSITPRGRQALNWILLAPAWTHSNLHLALSALKTRSIGGRLGRRWVMGAAVTWFVTTQMLNYAYSSWYNRNGKIRPDHPGGWFTWDNSGAPEELGDPLGIKATQLPINEHWSDIYAGVNPDGTERYIRFGKAFREPFRWLTSPMQTLGEKSSPAIKGPIIALTGSSPGSGFRFFDPRKRESGARRIAGIVDEFIPFFAQDEVHKAESQLAPTVFPERRETTQFFSQPTSIGMTKERATDAYALALERKDPSAARSVLQAAAANHLKVNDIVRAGRLAYLKKLRKGMNLPHVRYSSEGEPLRPE